MMLLRKNNLKYMKTLNKIVFSLCLIGGVMMTFAQQDDEALNSEKAVKVKDTVKRKMVKIDGVAAVVGDYIILDSDIVRAMEGLQSNDVPKEEITHCALLGKLMEDKLYMHNAVQDSIEVTTNEVRSGVEQRIEFYLNQVNGDMEKLLEIYGFETEGEFREELSRIVKEMYLTDRMREKIIENVEVTPEEVRTFFFSIPEDERPRFGESVEISQIVIEPKAPEEEERKVVEKLRKIKEDIEDNGTRFASNAMLYSQDPGSKMRGGLYTSVTRKMQFIKEFKDVAFSLQEGEISDPFKTDFGWHILTVDKIRGEQRDVRHILMRPEIPYAAIQDAEAKADSIRKLVIDDKISFAEAAKTFSDDKTTKYDEGKIINPKTLDLRFELVKMEPTMYNNIHNLKEGELSFPIYEENPRDGTVSYKIYKINKKTEDHIADYSNDYVQIQELALRDKQLKIIKEWTEEKIEDTFININQDNKDCVFVNNWFKE